MDKSLESSADDREIDSCSRQMNILLIIESKLSKYTQLSESAIQCKQLITKSVITQTNKQCIPGK